MKKIPYGKINFKKLIEDNCYYVDKTMYLEKLEDVGKTLIYLRPRKFGKSLFTSMMYYYYDINSKELFDSLFKECYVYKNPTKEKNSYYVLKFDFSGITTFNKRNEEIEQSFKNCVINGIRMFIEKYKFEYEVDNQDVADILKKKFFNIYKGIRFR